VLTCHWDFGDGTSADGLKVQHAFTHAGDYDVQVTVTGLGAVTNRNSSRVSIAGDVSTRFDPQAKQRTLPLH
jgi:alpha-galactosidase